jgi:hypothetical protein
MRLQDLIALHLPEPGTLDREVLSIRYAPKSN